MEAFEAGFTTQCVTCNDTGAYQVPQCTATLPDGSVITVAFDQPRVCDCSKGKEISAAWRDNKCWGCDYGVVILLERDSATNRETRSISFCKICDVGKTYQSKLDSVVNERWQNKLDRLMTGSQLAPKLRNCTFENYITGNNPELVKARDMVEDAAMVGSSIVLYGRTGIGKSHLSAAYLNKWMQSGRGGIFTTMSKIWLGLRDTINNPDSGHSWKELLDNYIQVDLLIIDDLGKEKSSVSSFEALFSILKERDELEKVTVLSSNKSLDALGQLIMTEGGLDEDKVEPLISRLYEYNPLTWDAPDYRRL